MKRILRSVFYTILIITALPARALAAELIPVGQLIGLQLRSGSVTVAAYDDALGTNARSAGLKIGDEILSVDNKTVSCAEDVRSALDDCEDSIRLTIRREGLEKNLTLSVNETNDGPRLGIYLRQGIAGVGTVTFYDPDTGLFGTLGHGVCDGKGKLLEMTTGSAYEAAIASVKKGRAGDPGQLKGSAGQQIGSLTRNTPQGVFGINRSGWSGEALPVADYEELHNGSASIRSTVCEDGPREYSVEILKIYPEDRTDGRNFLIKVTDPRLLENTGGIVQGMSGSPIIQDGKLIGAVTHVLVNDPTRGYGIFIENMLEAAQ
jgi:stage IV sporulation protein B